MENRKTPFLNIEPVRDIYSLSREILRLANSNAYLYDFLENASKIIFDFSGCDGLEIITLGPEISYRWQAGRNPEQYSNFERFNSDEKDFPNMDFACDKSLAEICRMVMARECSEISENFTRNCSFWTGNTSRDIDVYIKTGSDYKLRNIIIGGDYMTIALIHYEIDRNNSGLLILKSLKPDFFTIKDVQFFEGVTQILGVAISDRRAQSAVRERVKELSCLYRISQILEENDFRRDVCVQGIADTIPQAFQYPDIVSVRIFLDDADYVTSGFNQTNHSINADIISGGQKRGILEVFHSEVTYENDEVFFLEEEQSLIDAIAKLLSQILDRETAIDERNTLEEQLRHADRLATIGQLAAGVAHELNEPLGSILGFSQLIAKNKALTEQVLQDNERITKASLHAREIIKKLMLFGRQTPPRMISCSINELIDEALYFLEARLSKSRIKLEKEFSENMPDITADPSQLNQVFVNLIVNAIQAMPQGGTLTIRTLADKDYVMFSITDTGTGMSSEIINKIFLPFFTTKDINEGTGLGLPVVHGIITAHGGTIDVKSIQDEGSVFTVKLPLNPKQE